MPEYPQFNIKPQTGPDKLNKQVVKSNIELTPKELSEQENMEELMASAVHIGDYEPISYLASDGSTRVKVVDGNDETVYDGDIEHFTAINPNLSIQQIAKLKAEAKRSS